jgi:hypothetical protein
MRTRFAWFNANGDMCIHPMHFSCSELGMDSHRHGCNVRYGYANAWC